MSSAAMSAGGPGLGAKTENGSKDHGPGLFERVTNTHAYERVRDEAANIGDAFVGTIEHGQVGCVTGADHLAAQLYRRPSA